MERKFSVGWAEVTIDCHDPETLASFWSQLLDVAVVEPPLPGWARTGSDSCRGPVLNFQPVAEPKAGKSRLHLDLWTDNLQSTADWVREHGGAYTGEAHLHDEGTVAVMTDPEGTEFCVVGAAGSFAPSLASGGATREG